jgi:hypothetical protein
MMTPYEKFRSLSRPSQHLKPGITFKNLDALANKMTDNEAAEQLHSCTQHEITYLNNSMSDSK